MQLARRIHHVSLLVADTERAAAFYEGVLGLQRVADRPDLGFPGAWLAVGGQQIHLLELPSPDACAERPAHGGRDRHVAMEVVALGPVVERLEAADIRYTLSRSGRQALFCRDPDGNAIELIEVVEPR